MESALVAPLISLRKLQEWQDPVLIQDATVCVQDFGLFRVRAFSDDLWHVLPWREQSISNFIRATLAPGDVFIDAGANIGIYTVLASRLVGPAGRVISVEMMPDTADRLEMHVRLNNLDNVTIVRNALSDSADQVLTAMVQRGKYGQAALVNGVSTFANTNSIEVNSTTLDAISNTFKFVKLIKIDVEGAELKALNGAVNLLTKSQFLVYESWGLKREDSNPVDNLLMINGFALRQLDGNNWVAERTFQNEDCKFIA